MNPKPMFITLKRIPQNKELTPLDFNESFVISNSMVFNSPNSKTNNRETEDREKKRVLLMKSFCLF